VKELINKKTKGPHIRFCAIDTMNEALRRHVVWRANVCIPEVFPLLILDYFENTANPKSAILTVDPLKNTLATLISLCTIFIDAR